MILNKDSSKIKAPRAIKARSAHTQTRKYNFYHFFKLSCVLENGSVKQFFSCTFIASRSKTVIPVLGLVSRLLGILWELESTFPEDR